MKIRVKEITKGCKFEFSNKGEYIDLRAARDVNFIAPHAYIEPYEDDDTKEIELKRFDFDFKIIPLGIAMELPKDFEAVIIPRSSLFKKKKIMQANSEGLIDSTYCGDTDEWGFPAVAMDMTFVTKGDRLCQFRIRPSMKASVWTKIKWLFTRKIEFEWVESLDNKSRGGFGSTGVN